MDIEESLSYVEKLHGYYIDQSLSDLRQQLTTNLAKIYRTIESGKIQTEIPDTLDIRFTIALTDKGLFGGVEGENGEKTK